MRKKILYIVNGDFYAGAERVQDILAQRLPEFGYDVEFACLKEGQFAAKRQSQTPLYQMAMGSRFDLSPAWRIIRCIRREGYAALHTHTVRSLMIGALAAKLAGVPLIHHVHSPSHADTETRARNLVNSTIERMTVGQAAKMIVVSESLRFRLRQSGYPEDRIRLVPNGVGVQKTQNDWQVPQTMWTLGMVALFRPRKGLEVLLRATEKLLKNGTPMRLRLVGGFETPAYENEIKILVHDLQIENSIDWIGFTDDVLSELQRMNIFVVPSLYGEGMPMVMLEAMAAGLPVIGTTVEGIPEVLQQGPGG